MHAIKALAEVPFGWTAADLETVCGAVPQDARRARQLLVRLDTGSEQDEEVRLAGIVGHLQLCERLGAALWRLRQYRQRS